MHHYQIPCQRQQLDLPLHPCTNAHTHTSITLYCFQHPSHNTDKTPFSSEALYAVYVCCSCCVLLTLWSTPSYKMQLLWDLKAFLLSISSLSLILSSHLLNLIAVYHQNLTDSLHNCAKTYSTKNKTLISAPKKYIFRLKESSENSRSKEGRREEEEKKHTGIHPVSQACHRHLFAVGHWEPGMLLPAPATPLSKHPSEPAKPNLLSFAPGGLFC